MPSLATPLLSSTLDTPQISVLHSWVSFHAATAVSYVPHYSTSNDALWDNNNLVHFFTPPPDPFQDDGDVEITEEEEMEVYTPQAYISRRRRRPRKRHFRQVRKIRKNGGILIDNSGVMAARHEPVLLIQHRSIDRSLKSSLVLQKFCPRLQDYVDLALIIEIPGPASETWQNEGGGGWWGTASETEKLLAVTCRTLMRGRGNGLGVLFGVVLGGTQVRFFKWTDDASQHGGGRFEDLAVLLGIAEDEEDYPSSDDEEEINEHESSNGMVIDSADDEPIPSSSKGKGKARVDSYRDPTPLGQLNAQNISLQQWVAPPTMASAIPADELPDIFDTPVPPISDRSGYYDVLFCSGKARQLFHYIGGYEVL